MFVITEMDEQYNNVRKKYRLYPVMFLYSKKYIDFLCSTKYLSEMEQFLSETVEHNRKTCGENILLYGVPGSGKSWTIAHEYCNEKAKVERLVFHPDYT